jgi:hypothetical protein
MWFRSFSIVSVWTPSLCKPDAADRLRSCIVQFGAPTIASSSPALILDPTQQGDLPVVVNAPDGEHRRLQSVELEARGLDRFTRDTPSLIQTVELRDWNSSGHKLWPHGSSGSLAAAYAQGMAAPYHPGSNWADPEVQQRRRAEVEKEQQRLAEHYAQAAEQQESRLNREERERFGLRS